MLRDLLPNLGNQTYIMGILNLTADSFSGDGLLQQGKPLQAAITQARGFAADGAHILDVGAESTRPGAAPVSAELELERLLPVLGALREELPDIILSVDTYKACVAEEALRAGAHIINDVWGLRADPNMGAVVAASGASLVMMHNRSTRKTPSLISAWAADMWIFPMGRQRRGGGGLAAVRAHREGSGNKRWSNHAGPRHWLWQDTAQNLRLLKELNRLKALGFPLLLGISRKSFIGYTLNLPPEDRLEGSLAANA
jgi:dihydropteroate synthase